jgi:hypothetical protein
LSVFDLRDIAFEHLSDLLGASMRRASAAMIDLDVRAINLREQALSQKRDGTEAPSRA